MIADQRIFGECCINLVGFSLGCLLIAECIKELDRINNCNLIYDVVFMGGAVNTKLIDAIDFHCVQGQVSNCYSRNDGVL